MAWFSRKVRAVHEGSLFVAPAADRRQLTLLRIEVERLGDSRDGVNMLVIPVPRSAVRGPMLVDASRYASAFRDLENDFEVAVASIGVAKDVYFREKSSRVAICESIDELDHVRMDGISLRIPRRIVRLAEAEHSGSLWSFLVVVFSQKYPVVRLHLAYTHPLMLGRLYVPCVVFGPRGIPQGERFDICNDEDPKWNQLTMRLYAANTTAPNPENNWTLEQVQMARSESEPRSGLIYGMLPLEEGSARPSILHLSLVTPSHEAWLRISTAYKGLQRAASCMESGNFAAARRVFAGLLKHKPCSGVMARYAAFCATQGDEEEALELFRRAAETNPHNTLTLVLFGQCVAQSDPDRAEQAFKRALRLDPYEATASEGAGLSLTAGGEGGGGQGEALLRRALLLAPNTSLSSAARLQSLNRPIPDPRGNPRAERALLADQKEKQLVQSHIGLYLDHLNFERLALFPGEEAL